MRTVASSLSSLHEADRAFDGGAEIDGELTFKTFICHKAPLKLRFQNNGLSMRIYQKTSVSVVKLSNIWVCSITLCLGGPYRYGKRICRMLKQPRTHEQKHASTAIIDLKLVENWPIRLPRTFQFIFGRLGQCIKAPQFSPRLWTFYQYKSLPKYFSLRQ